MTSEPGFVAYVGAPSTTDEELVFFFNIFNSESESLDAQAAAASFKEDGVLNDEIEPELFTTGLVAFQINADNICPKVGLDPVTY